MAARKVTPEEFTRRENAIKAALARRPDLTKNHFNKHFGCSYEWMATLEAKGVKFGQRTNQQIKL